MNRLALACAFAVAAFAQNQKLAYEVATIKLNTSGDGMMRIAGLGPGPGGGVFRVTNLPLRQLIVLAYADRSQGPPALGGGPGLAVTGGPSWINTDRYDIEARPEQGFIPTVEQGQKMLQALLEERFGLQVRHETKDGPIYALTVAKGGLKTKKSADQTPLNFGAPTPGGPAGGPPPTPAALQSRRADAARNDDGGHRPVARDGANHDRICGAADRVGGAEGGRPDQLGRAV